MLDHIIRRIRWWLSWPERRKIRRWFLEFDAQHARRLDDRDLCRFASGSCVSSTFQAACIAEALRRGLDVPAKELR